MTDYRTPRDAANAVVANVCGCSDPDRLATIGSAGPSDRDMEGGSAGPSDWETEGEEALGTYQPMSSPGMATLKTGALRAFFARQVLAPLQALDLPLTTEDCRRMCRWTVAVTAEHQIFRHLCDRLRDHRGGARFDPDEEEPLAVGWSFLRTFVNPLDGGRWRSPLIEAWPNPTLVGPFVERRLKGYPCPPYKDWHTGGRDSGPGWVNHTARYLGRVDERALLTQLLALAHEAHAGSPHLVWRVE